MYRKNYGNSKLVGQILLQLNRDLFNYSVQKAEHKTLIPNRNLRFWHRWEMAHMENGVSTVIPARIH